MLRKTRRLSSASSQRCRLPRSTRYHGMPRPARPWDMMLKPRLLRHQRPPPPRVSHARTYRPYRHAASPASPHSSHTCSLRRPPACLPKGRPTRDTHTHPAERWVRDPAHLCVLPCGLRAFPYVPPMIPDAARLQVGAWPVSRAGGSSPLDRAQIGLSGRVGLAIGLEARISPAMPAARPPAGTFEPPGVLRTQPAAGGIALGPRSHCNTRLVEVCGHSPAR